MKGRAKTIAKWLVTVGVFGYLGKMVADQWGQLRAYSWDIRPFLLGWGFLLAVAAFWMFVRIWQQILHALGARISYRKAYHIWFVSALLRYLPGKMAGLVSMVYLCEKEGISKATCVSSGVLNQAFSILSGLTVGAFLIVVHPTGGVDRRTLILGLSLVACALAVFPLVVDRVINPFLRRRGRSVIVWKMDPRRFLLCYAFYVAAWLVWGAGFFILVRSLTDISVAYLPHMAAVFTITYLAGFLSMLTPNGLGVREGLLTALLAPYLPAPVAVVVALVSRIWLTLAEMVCILVAHFWK